MGPSIVEEKDGVPLERDIERHDVSQKTTSRAEKQTSTSSPVSEHDEVTEEQLQTLRHVPDRMPMAAYLVVVFSSMERFSYFGFAGPLRKMIAPKVEAASDGRLQRITFRIL